MVYINGQLWPTDAAAVRLDAQAARLIEAHGPYTQDYARVLPILQPVAAAAFLDSLLVRTASLAERAAPADARSYVRALVGRPPHDPGGPTPVDFLPPLENTDTKSYLDMVRIVHWATRHVHDVYSPQRLLALVLLGDGQSVLRMRDLKRKYPAQYKHVLVLNGGFHSFAHFMFATQYLWWKSMCAAALPSRRRRRRAPLAAAAAALSAAPHPPSASAPARCASASSTRQRTRRTASAPTSRT